jgi:hypothetical protein
MRRWVGRKTSVAKKKMMNQMVTVIKIAMLMTCHSAFQVPVSHNVRSVLQQHIPVLRAVNPEQFTFGLPGNGNASGSVGRRASILLLFQLEPALVSLQKLT